MTWWPFSRGKSAKLEESRTEYERKVWKSSRTESALRWALGLAGASSPPEQFQETVAAVQREAMGTDMLLLQKGPDGALPDSDINRTIARLEHFAVSTTRPDDGVAYWLWAFTLRGIIDPRFRIPCCHIWHDLIAGEQSGELLVPGYVREWLRYHGPVLGLSDRESPDK